MKKQGDRQQPSLDVVKLMNDLFSGPGSVHCDPQSASAQAKRDNLPGDPMARRKPVRMATPARATLSKALLNADDDDR